MQLLSTPFVLIYIFRDKDIRPKNELWCASIVYYNNRSKSFDTTYSTTTIFDADSIVNFTDPNGRTWWSRDFISNEDRKDEDDLDYNDITIKNGERFKVFPISNGKCQTKAIEDSLKDNLNTSNDNNDNQ